MTNFLDVGVGTGRPLYEVLNTFPPQTQILGVDIDENYVRAAQKLFTEKKHVVNFPCFFNNNGIILYSKI